MASGEGISPFLGLQSDLANNCCKCKVNLELSHTGILTTARKIFPCHTGQRPYIDQEMNRWSTPKILATDPATSDCPSCVENPDDIVGITSHAATPLQMEAETVCCRA